MANYHVISLTQTCWASPYQLEGKTSDGKSVYVRYRSGRLNIYISGISILLKRIKVQEGNFTFTMLLKHSKGIVEWL